MVMCGSWSLCGDGFVKNYRHKFYQNFWKNAPQHQRWFIFDNRPTIGGELVD